ncbi:MAG: hypothetical protein AB3N11_12305 [Arenibacterium sp.]
MRAPFEVRNLIMGRMLTLKRNKTGTVSDLSGLTRQHNAEDIL